MVIVIMTMCAINLLSLGIYVRHHGVKCPRVPLTDIGDHVNMSIIHIQVQVCQELCWLVLTIMPLIEGCIELIGDQSTETQ
jgi:hypothetical protein